MEEKLIDADTESILDRIAVALERIAAQGEPQNETREHSPAVLSTAIYNAEERERKALRDQLKGKT